MHHSNARAFCIYLHIHHPAFFRRFAIVIFKGNFTTDQEPRMELPVAGVIKCTINWNIKNTMGMDGLDYPWRAVDCLWFLLHPVGGWWEMWVMWARAPWGSAFVCNRWRSRPKNSVLTSSLSECQRPTYNRVWSLCPRPDSAGHSGSLSVWILSGI